METSSLERLVLPLLASLLLCACRDGSESPAIASASATFLIGDAPAADLDYFVAEVSSLRLRRADGTLTDDFLPEGGFGILHRQVEFLRLDETFQWLGSALDALEPGNYEGLVLGFRPLSYQGRTESGVFVDVLSTADELEIGLVPPLVLGSGDHATFRIDLDLGAALSGDPESGMLLFTPAGSCHVDDGAQAAPVEEFLAQVVSVDVAGSSLLVSGIEHSNPLGELRVIVEPDTLLLDDLNVERADPGFLVSILPVVTLLEIQGSFGPGGELHATRIEVGDFDIVARVEGRVIGLDLPNGLLTLGRTLFERDTNPGPELLGSLDPIVLAYDAQTTFLVRDPAQVVAAASLAVGQRLEARVLSYAGGEPFAVFEVELPVLLPTFEGAIVSIAGPPTSLVAELTAHDPAVVSGLVESSSTAVAVAYGSALPVLATPGKPVLQPEDLQVGLEFECAGALSGPPEAPALTAAELRILPGWLDDALLGVVDVPTSSFTTTLGELRDPFGPGVTPGPQTVLVDPACVFTGDVEDADSFFTLFGSGPTTGAALDVHGIGTAEPDTIRAFAIRVTTL